MRVAITYAVVAWLIIQVASTTFGDFGIPVWAFRFVVIMLGLFFPVALIITWAFELTPEGIKTTKSARESQGDEPVSKKVQRKRNWMALGFAAAVPTVIFGALAVYFYATRAVETEASGGDKSIAVLPLANMSPDPENAFFADGVQKDILTNLSKIDAFRVLARTSTLQYRDTVETIETIGDELGVNYLVEDSVRRAGDRVKITVQLIDCLSGDHIWADDYDRSLDDTFAIQAGVAKEIAAQLQMALSPEEINLLDYRPTDNQEAYDYFMKARLLINSTTRRGDDKIQLLSQAVGLDRNFAEAWAQLAVECIYWWRVGRDRNDPVLLALAESSLTKAATLQPGSAAMQYAEGIMARDRDDDSVLCIQHLERAVEIDPNLEGAQANLAIMAYSSGYLSNAKKHFEQLLRITPLHKYRNELLLLIYWYLEEWELARGLIETNLRREGDAVFWETALAQSQFLQTGNWQALYEKYAAASDTRENANIIKAIFERDFDAASKILETTSDQTEISLFADPVEWIGLNDKGLIQGLISLERGELEKSRQFAVETRTRLTAALEDENGDDDTITCLLAICHALERQEEAMGAAIVEARELAGSQPWLKKLKTEFLVAIAHVAQGKTDRALETLEAAKELPGFILLKRELGFWFMFDRLRGNPRFDALLEG